MTSLLAAEEPFWQPGTRNGYHGLTYGFLVGELVRRVSGKSLGVFFRQAVAQSPRLDLPTALPHSAPPHAGPPLPAPPLQARLWSADAPALPPPTLGHPPV